MSNSLVGDRARPRRTDLLELFLVVGDAATAAAHGEGRADDGGVADGGLNLDRLLQAMGNRGSGHIQADAAHGLAKTVAILSLVDGVPGGPNQLDAEALQHPLAHQVQGAVQRGLPTHGGQQRIGTLDLDDACQGPPGDRLDIGGIRHLRVGHDGGRIGVDQDDPKPLLAQRLAGLGPGVIELARLADDDGPGADDEDAVDVGTLWHSEFFVRK